jgi:hemoglobin
MSSQEISISNDLLVLRLGGKSDFDLIVMEFCGKIIADPELQPIYKDLDMDDLLTHQKEFLSLVFGERPEDMDSSGRIAIRHHDLFQKGLNETHYDKVVEHFEEALQECWVEQDVTDDLLRTLRQYKILFGRGEQDNKTIDVAREYLVTQDEFAKQVETRKKEVRSRSAPRRTSSNKGSKKESVERSKSGDSLLSMFRVNRDKRK